ncbi:MAG: putative inner rane transrane protein [Variovorax sp.]|nr:putative inner rane transrane protein [Variovorax sp.]
MNQPTPAIVAQSAVRRLPRLALLLLCAAYLLPGLVGRGPWKSADIAAFGYMAELARPLGGGLARWLDPTLLHLPPDVPALLPYWIGAWAIDLAPAWLRPDLAVRIAFALLLWGVFTATWHAVYHLARTPRAQPVAFAFGGEAQPVDYARAMADGGLLALLACLGLAQLGHETTPALAQLFFSSCLFYGVAALPYRGLVATAALIAGTVGMTLSGAPTLALLLGLGSFLIAWRQRPAAVRGLAELSGVSPTEAGTSYPLGALVALGLATVLAAVLALRLGLFHWSVVWPGHRIGVTLKDELHSQAKLLLWFTWPAWPLTVWTLWRWRRQLAARHVALPLLFAMVPLAATLATEASDRSLLLALPALATLAAFALPTFRRSAAALVDWFTLLFFSGSAIIIWVIWIAMQTGVPAKPAANVARLAPGFVPEFSLPAFAFALAGTIAWCWLVKWRTGRHQAALWKTLVLPAGGAALCWLLLMTLWLPLLDYARSYGPQVRAVTERVGRAPCLSELGLSRPHIAALRHHGGFALQPLARSGNCPWLLVAPEALGQLPGLVSLDHWRFAGTLRRPTNASDDLLLYQRIDAPGTLPDIPAGAPP